jgi:hypothetical protein
MERAVHQAQIAQNSRANYAWSREVVNDLHTFIRASNLDDVAKDTVSMMLRQLDESIASATSRVDSKYQQVVDRTFSLRDRLNKGDVVIANVWDEVKNLYPRIQGDMPEILTRQQFKDILFDVGYRPNRVELFAGQREAIADIVRTSTAQIVEVMGNALQPGDVRLLQETIGKAEKALDNARLFDNAIYVDGYKHLVPEMKENFDGLMRLSRAYGIPGVTATGAYNPRFLNAINKYLPEGSIPYLSIHDVPFNVAQEALAARAMDRGDEAIRVFSGMLDIDMGNIPSSDATQLQKLFAGFEDATPTYVDMLHESSDGINDILERLKTTVTEKYGYTTVNLDKQQQLAVEKWLNAAQPKINQARAQSVAYADASVDFALHNYRDKYGFDKLLGYIFPYQFWHSRTYAKWFTQRVLQNPGVISGYAKYREALEKIHADSPEWWRYNINTNELLGTDAENPLYFNLEASFNQLYQLVGVGFNDKNRRVDWWSALVDDLGKVGPSVNPLISIATGLAIYQRGREQTSEQLLESGARWVGRLFPQTTTLESLSHVSNIDLPFGLETLDPAVWALSGGMDTYERRRVGRALGGLIGEYPEADVIEAGYNQSGPIWDHAISNARDLRAPGNLMSFFLGFGFKGRTQEEVQIDNFYGDFYSLIGQRNNYSPQEYRDLMNGLRNQYPFMGTVLLSSKLGPERDEALVYNVMARIPPGQSTEIFDRLGISPDLLDKFYNDKGNMSSWAETDRQEFMAAIINGAVVLDIPDSATRDEWISAKNAYTTMTDDGMVMFGDDIWERTDIFFQKYKEDKESAYDYLDRSPIVEQAMEWKKEVVLNDPLLSAYYGGLDMITSYYEGQKWDDIDNKFGPNIFELWDEYYDILDTGGEVAKDFRNTHPEINGYYEARDDFRFQVENELGDDVWAKWDMYDRAKLYDDPMIARAVWINNKDVFENYMSMNDEFKERMAAVYGDNIVFTLATYRELVARGEEEAKRFMNTHPELEEYRDVRDEWDRKVVVETARLASYLPKGIPAEVRDGANTDAVGAYNLAEYIQNPPQELIPLEAWEEIIPEAVMKGLVDGALSPVDAMQMERIAAILGIDPQYMIDSVLAVIP